jgi:hypothetical protein
LAYHGRDNLLRKYRGKPALQEVFKFLLRVTARTPPSLGGIPWDKNNYGPGILDVEALLRAPLPDRDLVPTHNWILASVLELLYQLYRHLDPALVRDRLMALLQVTLPILELTLDTIGFELQKFMLDNTTSFESMARSAATSAVQAALGVRNAVQSAGNFISRKLKGVLRLF